MSQNMGLEDYDNNLTSQGREMIEAILARRAMLLESAGMRPDDQQALALMLDRIETQYKAGGLDAVPWSR